MSSEQGRNIGGAPSHSVGDEAMRAIDAAYRLASGLQARRHYKIFYSHIHPFPILVLGHNPGGETDGKDLVASDRFFENWEHDFVRFRHCSAYPLAGAMCDLLEQVLRTHSADILRQIPVSNVIFRRSKNMTKLTRGSRHPAEEAQPFLSRMIELVGPQCIILVSKIAFDLFKTYHCRPGSTTEDASSRVYTPNGRHPACIFLKARSFVSVLDREVPLLMIGHPSKFSARQEWGKVTSELRSALQQLGISPLEGSPLLTKILPLSACDAQL